MEEQGLFVPFVPVQRDGSPRRHLLRGDEELLRAREARPDLEQHGAPVLKRRDPLAFRWPEDDTSICSAHDHGRLAESGHSAAGTRQEQ
jgi:hypothetical protein